MNRPVDSVAIAHYHLRSAGVTRVIQHAAASLRSRGVRVVVLSGEDNDASFAEGVDVRVVPGLGYDYGEGATPVPWFDVVARLQDAAKSALGGPPDLWHIHNHSLGKNVHVPAAVRAIIDSGQHVLLQPHDFAEDGRPDNYAKLLRHAGGDHAALGTTLYPVATHVHYATLNTRDRNHLLGAGLPDDRVHVLPNAVSLSDSGEAPADKPCEGRFFLYATRAIRRKNVGELLLWAAMGEPGDLFATTLAPKSPADLPIYADWKQYAAEKSLPVRFEAGAASDASFIAMLKSADALITTSAAEGFGLAFLEPWLVGQPLVGRNLPSITADFAAEGVDMSPLYDRLDVPLAWIGADALRDHIAAKMRQAYDAYRQTCDDVLIEAAFDAFVRKRHVDFGRLDEPLQRRVIDTLLSTGDRDAIAPPRLVGDDALGDDRVARNQQIVRERFNLDAYGDRLMSLYDAVLRSPVGPVGSVSAEAVLGQFLSPEQFNLLRT